MLFCIFHTVVFQIQFHQYVSVKDFQGRMLKNPALPCEKMHHSEFIGDIRIKILTGLRFVKNSESLRTAQKARNRIVKVIGQVVV